MFAYQEHFGAPTVPVTSELFSKVIISGKVVNNIKEARKCKEAGDDKGYDAYKRKLPVFIYQATFKETKSQKGGNLGAWRKQESAVLNGLVMIDIDHIEDPKGVFERLYYCGEGDKQEQKTAFCKINKIKLVHVTCSGEGLRFVIVGDPSKNLFENQKAFCEKYHLPFDESCKDASRISFAPGFEDILWLDTDIFFINEPAFEEKWGEHYRKEGSRTKKPVVGNLFEKPKNNDDKTENQSKSLPERKSDEQESDALSEQYRKVPYGKIIDKWFENQCGGKPGPGDRHRNLFKLACDLRYICDDVNLLARLIKECSVGVEVASLRGEEELARLTDDALHASLYQNIPARLQSVLKAAGCQQAAATDESESDETHIDYGYWWERLHPLLEDSPILREAVADLPDRHKIGGVLAAGAMLGTYLTRCWWPHFDGKNYRLSFLVYIIGGAASGKSFVVDMDKLLMAPMIAADNAGRKWEREYKEEMKKRAASSKNAKEAAPEQLHPVIRYLPSTISNAMLYRRLMDAVDNDCPNVNGDPMHLHCYTCEAELATALRAQQGSWAGKLDLECKSFQNEVAGVDYANEQSTNGIIEINWNQVISGTPDAMRRKIKPSTVLDGLVTRLCVFTMPSNDYAMIERRKVIVDHDRNCLLRSVGLDLEQLSGEIVCPELVDMTFDYEAALCRQAEDNKDVCLDYFRKRIPLIMMRYAIVRAVCRQYKELPKRADGFTLKIEPSDLEFARLIGDFVLMEQMYMFGNEVMQALENESRASKPRGLVVKTEKLYQQLPDEFTLKDVQEMFMLSPYAAGMRMRRLIEKEMVEKVSQGKYVKLKK